MAGPRRSKGLCQDARCQHTAVAGSNFGGRRVDDDGCADGDTQRRLRANPHPLSYTHPSPSSSSTHFSGPLLCQFNPSKFCPRLSRKARLRRRPLHCKCTNSTHTWGMCTTHTKEIFKGGRANLDSASCLALGFGVVVRARWKLEMGLMLLARPYNKGAQVVHVSAKRVFFA